MSRYPEGVNVPPLAPATDTLRARLERALEQAPIGLTRAELRKAAGSNAIPAREIDDVLESLRSAWKVTTYQRKTAGRPAQVWQHTRYTAAHRIGEEATPAAASPAPVSQRAPAQRPPMSALEAEFADLAAELRRIGFAPTPPTPRDADLLEPLIEAAQGNRQLYAGCRPIPGGIRRGSDARGDCRRMARDLATGRLRIFVSEDAR